MYIQGFHTSKYHNTLEVAKTLIVGLDMLAKHRVSLKSMPSKDAPGSAGMALALTGGEEASREAAEIPGSEREQVVEELLPLLIRP